MLNTREMYMSFDFGINYLRKEKCAITWLNPNISIPGSKLSERCDLNQNENIEAAIFILVKVNELALLSLILFF
jgi:hypothetical protein